MEGPVATEWTDDQLIRGGWRGAVLGPDGNKVYGIPTNATSVLEVDVARRQVRTFGRLGGTTPDSECAGAIHCGADKWIDGVLAPNGKIFGIPFGADTVLEIDPAMSSVSTFGVISSPVQRKWLGGVLGANGLIYAIPYDAETVLEIDPETHAMTLFGAVGRAPCKWYGGVLAPNNKIYAIPYSERYILEIDPETHRAIPFAMVASGWGKWAGGVLATNGKIYGIPALSTSILEFDVYNPASTETFGNLPNTGYMSDKWNGGVLASNGKIYGMPWRSSSILEFDPATKAIGLRGNLPHGNFSWHGGILSKSGKVVALPYNSKRVLEISNVCAQRFPTSSVTSDLKERTPMLAHAESDLADQPDADEMTDDRLRQRYDSDDSARSEPPKPFLAPFKAPATKPITNPASQLQTFVLAMIGCPEAAKTTEDMCFSMGHRTWHSAMITIADRDTTLSSIREKVLSSRLAHMPTNYCFLFKGYPLDPTIEKTLQATAVATSSEQGHSIVLIDNLQCTAIKQATPMLSLSFMGTIYLAGAVVLVLLALTYLAVAPPWRRADAETGSPVAAGAANESKQTQSDCLFFPPKRCQLLRLAARSDKLRVFTAEAKAIPDQVSKAKCFSDVASDPEDVHERLLPA